ncbi:MAG TPA: hypothetical protein PK668_08090 [Myxococcota bacterium]|nr:hypothetical protein [Myxococcota bacterium]HRY93065.1 hypothetical protein [Myxococcota bacterium]HSA24811.1 hypothetical protein [Myxococcota bacterium]
MGEGPLGLELRACPACGKRRLVPQGKLFSGEKEARLVLSVAFQRNRAHPPAKQDYDVFVSSPLLAAVCGACGHVELSAAEPQKIWDALLEAEGQRQAP